MKGRNRLAINLLIVGGVLLFGSLIAPRSSRGGSPGGSGQDVTVPGYTVDHMFMYRGQTYSMTFWGSIRTSPNNVTFLPVDLYVMTLEQYRGFVENCTRQSLFHITSSLGTVDFKPERSGHYFFVLERLEPAGEKCLIGSNVKLGGVILDFLQPAQILLFPATALLTYNMFLWLNKRRLRVKT